MPRIVDHDQRRAELATAVWRLISKNGLAGVTIRHLSEESGWSAGAIRHYLPTRQRILSFAAEHLMIDFELKLNTRPRLTDRKEDFLSLLIFCLPTDQESRLAIEVWLAFVGSAVSDQDFSDTQGFLYKNFDLFFVDLLKDLEQEGWSIVGPLNQVAGELHAVIDGLCIHMLLNEISLHDAKAILSTLLDRILKAPSA